MSKDDIKLVDLPVQDTDAEFKAAAKSIADQDIIIYQSYVDAGFKPEVALVYARNWSGCRNKMLFGLDY